MQRGGLIYWAAKERTSTIYREEIDILVHYTHTYTQTETETHTYTHRQKKRTHTSSDSLISLSFFIQEIHYSASLWRLLLWVCVCVCMCCRQEWLCRLYNQVCYLDLSRSANLLCMTHQTPCAVCVCVRKNTYTFTFLPSLKCKLTKYHLWYISIFSGNRSDRVSCLQL